MTKAPSTPAIRVRFDRFEIDEAEARLTEAGEPIHLAPKPFALLCALARVPRTLVSKSDLLDLVWGHQFVSESVLKTTISDLRAALHDDPKQPRFIETVSRRGYRFLAEVIESRASAPSSWAADSASAQLPAKGAPAIGRDDALRQLRSAWDLAAAGRRQLVWVSGEAGVGKSTVVERFMGEVGEASWAHGQCVAQYGQGEPYLAILEALTGLSRRDPSLVELVRAVAPTWLFQLPWLSTVEERDALRRELAGASPSRMVREMGELLDRYTEQRPLLLVTEDMHWSDAATVQLMDHLARRRSGARFLWLATFRLTELIAAEHPLATVRHELRLHGLGKEIVLDHFSEDEVGAYVRARAASLAADREFVRALHERTEGLPLFVADVLDELVAHLGDELDARTRLARMAIPETLSGVIERYIDELTAEQRSLLEAASVIGVQFRVPTVAGVLGLDSLATAEACAELSRRHRWLRDLAVAPQGDAGSGFAFRHALYRELLYKRIGPLARVDLHRRVARALEHERARGVTVAAAELASHFDLAHEPLAALRCYTEAAEASLLRFSPAQTMALTQRAVDLLAEIPDGPERSALEMTVCALRGTAAMQIDGFTSVEPQKWFERAVGRLDDVPGHPLRALFLSALGLAHHMRGEPDRATAIARRSEALANATGDQSALVCACMLYGFLERDAGRAGVAREWLERGIEAARALDASTSRAVFVADPAVLMLGLLALVLHESGFVDDSRVCVSEALDRAAALGQPGPRQAASWLEALLAVRMGDPERVAAAVVRLERLRDEGYEAPERTAAALWFRGWAEARLGDPREGHRLIREGYDHAMRIGMRGFAGETLGYAAEAFLFAGDAAAAQREVDEAMRSAESTGDRSALPRLHAIEARIASALGDRQGARAALARALAAAREQQVAWPELLALTALCERDDATPDERAALVALLDRATQGRDTPAFARAAALAGRRVVA